MAEELEIQIPWLRYDLTLPLIEGRVPIEGVKLVPNRLAPAGTVFGPDSPLRTGDFGLVDLTWPTGCLRSRMTGGSWGCRSSPSESTSIPTCSAARARASIVPKTWKANVS